jgi:hypothetical protein
VVAAVLIALASDASTSLDFPNRIPAVPFSEKEDGKNYVHFTLAFF